MCRKLWSWLFPPDVPVTPVEGSRVALLFAIDDYPGSGNDLPDCVIDQRNVEKFLQANYPEFKILKFSNSAVTTKSFELNVKNQISVLKEGDILLIHYSGHGTQGTNPAEPDGYSEGIYLADGQVFWDQKWGALLDLIPTGARVIIALDSCFAHGSTETRNSKKDNKRKVRFIETEKIPIGTKKAKSLLRTSMVNYLVFAACQEDQTSSSTGHGGVFTLHWIEAWLRQFSYLEWCNGTAELVEADGEVQVPNIEGDPALLDQTILI